MLNQPLVTSTLNLAKFYRDINGQKELSLEAEGKAGIHFMELQDIGWGLGH